MVVERRVTDLIMDGQGFALWNIHQSEALTLERLSKNIHPADKNRVRAAATAARALVGRHEIDFTILVVGDVRWLSARGQGDDARIQDRKVMGILLDFTGRKKAEKSHELLQAK